MSQSILVIASFRNNKRRIVGLHNPNNDIIANKDELFFLEKMIKKNIYPVQSKFKKVVYKVTTQDLNTITVKSLDEAVNLVLNDKVNH